MTHILIKYRSLHLLGCFFLTSPPQIFSFWQDHRCGSSCGHGCSNHSLGGAPETHQLAKEGHDILQNKECLTHCSTHLDDVRGDDKLRGFSVTLLARWTRWSQPKDPLHLVLQTLLAWLFIHGLAWRADRLHRLGLMAACKNNIHLELLT